MIQLPTRLDFFQSLLNEVNNMKKLNRVNPSTPRPEGQGLLRVDPERRFSTPPSKARLGAAEWVNAKGLTLIELLVALVICGVVIAGIYRLFIAQSKAYTVQDQVVEVQQSMSRSTMEILLRDLRMAGFDSDNVSSKISIANPLIAGDHSVTVSYEYDDTTQYTITYTRDAATKRLLRQLTTTKDDGSSIAGPQEALLENVEVLDFTYGVDTNDDGALDSWASAGGIGIGKVVAVRVGLNSES